MVYLDLAPMISSLRTTPSDFEMDRGWLTHFPSRHSFKFDPDGNVRLHASCACVQFSVRQEQGRELSEAFKGWHANYWRPIEVNREFASHFRRPTFVQRLLRRMFARIRQITLDPSLGEGASEIHAMHARVPAGARSERSPLLEVP